MFLDTYDALRFKNPGIYKGEYPNIPDSSFFTFK